MTAPVKISALPLRARDWWLVTVASMEQVIGTALSAVVGIMIPMLQLLLHPEMPSLLQGFVGAINLIGIGFGSVIIGRLSDEQGYLGWFRACPLIIAGGAMVCFFCDAHVWLLMVGLFTIGFGVGGGYSLDSAYISELMPDKWRSRMVGLAKSTCAIGFVAAALISYFIIAAYPTPHTWRWLILIVGSLGMLAFLMRLHWFESPNWLMVHGCVEAAQKATTDFFGPGVVPCAVETKGKGVGWGAMFRGENLMKVIFSGIPWACEGLGVYGFGVFLPVLVMALGIEKTGLEGMPKILQSVEVTTVVNCFIIPGFVLGLLLMNRLNHGRMLFWGFIGSALGLGLLLVAYLFHLPVWITIVGFLVFEIFLNAGPHLVTYIIPAAIYPVEDRGAGTGIAAMLGKVGAVIGVILMPLLLEAGGMRLVLYVSIGVMLLGGLIGLVFGKILKLI